MDADHCGGDLVADVEEQGQLRRRGLAVTGREQLGGLQDQQRGRAVADLKG
jgi:hypothetical protein